MGRVMNGGIGMESQIKGKTGAYRVLSGSVLKTIALLTMLLDHTAAHLFSKMRFALVPFMTIGGTKITWYLVFRTIGRIAFPLYCFLLVEGYLHTRSKERYGLRLLIFAIVSEIPWDLVHKGFWTASGQNVFFTLFLGLCAVYIWDMFREDPVKRTVCLLTVFGISLILHADYGIKGVGFILCLFLLQDYPLPRALVGCCFFARPLTVLPAFALTGLYNGKRGFIRGKVLQYLYYAIYPAHMLLLFFLRMHFFGYGT